MFSCASMDRYELAWAAGFFDGEGWAARVRFGRGDKRRAAAQINQADVSGVPEVLLRFRRAVGGLGRIRGPYVQDKRQDIYRWDVSSLGDVELLHHLLMPWLGQVKLVEFAKALERAAARSREAARTDEWRAWAAGLYDGEGSTYLLDHRTHEDRSVPQITVTQCGDSAVPEVLRRLVAIFSVGHLNGPYPSDEGRRAVYRWRVGAQTDVIRFVNELEPWLSSVKRAQAQRVVDVLMHQGELPRGRPDWGNRKTHCLRGHEYATVRIRPYISRGTGERPRDSKQCLQCAREQARARRRQKRRSAADDDRRSLSECATSYLLK